MPQISKRLAFRASKFLVAAAVLSGLFASITSARANPVVVVDVNSGKVLFSEQATAPWYPASITKLMTTYVALKAVRDGNIRMDSLLTVSKNSASLPPSKMGFKPGSQIRLDNALKIIMVKSANDVANTIAEGVGGSTGTFVEMMNRNAEYLGMVNTHFVNPHGLPDERQQTSARDMAILGRTLLLEFPEYNDLFHIGAIQFGKRVMRNTNGLIGRYPGADGMKTGFICAAGFNVVASATRGNRQLLTVILGAPSASERTLMAASLFDRGFSTASFFSPTLDSLPASNSVTPPNLRSQICEKRGSLSEDEDGAITTNGNSDSSVASFFGSSALAYADSDSGRASLGPRARAVPQMVWLGLNPPSSKELAADDEPKTKPLKGKAPAKAKMAVKPKTPTASKAKADAGKTPAPIKIASPPARPKAVHVKPPPPIRPIQISE